jgi:hypothetical protein
MTAATFNGWLTEWDKQLSRECRKILLLVNNFSGHASPPTLNNIRLEFFAPNMTSHIQPLDQGIIRAFKAIYRRNYLQHVMRRVDAKEDDIWHINQLTAMNYIYAAWSLVNSSSIANCFRHAGLKAQSDQDRSPSSPIIIDAADLGSDAPIIVDTAEESDLDAAVELEVQKLDDEVDELASQGVIQNRMSIEFFLNPVVPEDKHARDGQDVHKSDLGTESLTMEEFIDLQRAGCDTERGAPEDPDEIVILEDHHKSEHLLRQLNYIREASLMKPRTDDWVTVHRYASEMIRVFERHVEEQKKQSDLRQFFQVHESEHAPS